ncbi:MAG: hypothetical protein PHP64_07165 [Actinomycetota bacterium]|nr:hypothetical protein [Actinomycetota bacterium]
MITTKKKLRSEFIKGLLPIWIVAIFVCSLSGCGLETEKANQFLSSANRYQKRAEEILSGLKNFPSDWQNIFNVQKVGAEQIAAARALVDSRERDIVEIDSVLRKWGKELHRILSLNVDEKLKEYVRLKIDSINCYAEYLTSYLRPILKSYVGVIELLEAGRSLAQLNQQAEDIRKMVLDSVEKLEECKGAEKRAREYFKSNKLGS